MKQLIEFIPLILFFIAYKLYGVQISAVVLIVATLIQLVVLHLKFGKIEKSQKIMAIAVVFFGLLTVYFNDLTFLKWKVTVVYAIFATALFVSQYVFHKPLVKALLGKELVLPEYVWGKLNLGWAMFFFMCMVLNIFISHYFSDDAWYNFKVFGILGLTLIATLATGVYLYKYLPQESNNRHKD
ncbi:septation protein A [Pasteurellaceae bacterium HPA106]|uniref:septation protein A n=1 Tax=Spirabiliibacterium pneumoniae TaxID=221400 RepID=UPI001AADC045|nr:septation protein A [Spirabiliibacterium pneumoniae]MBE2895298.1 septation protein A [Spirabiliibacterium pneumoniae]